MVDPFGRKGYRFKGRAVICEPGSIQFAEGVERMRAWLETDRTVKAIVVIDMPTLSR